MKIFSFCQKGKRESQQDAVWISGDQKLLIVCDGVGGSGDGAAASRLVVDYFEKNYKDFDSKEVVEQFSSIIKNLVDKLKRAAGSIHKQLSTTIAMVYIDQGAGYFYHLGDSRLFYYSKKTAASWVSKDHSLVQDLFEIGVLSSEKEMRSHPMKNRVTKVLSSDIDLSKSDMKFAKKTLLLSEDIILICSDGVLENFSNNEMIKILANNTVSVEESFETIRRVCQEYSKDNNSCVLAVI
ncbi:MAG: serine/threonine-protein phosphatase [Chitinophagaceae bacterium]|nr:MAG: serine/threonine-protein phosphatase [Chitinophagaceae bacterium]